MIFSTTMDKWSAHAPKAWSTHVIRPIPCDTAPFVVTIAGKPYAGFYTRECAEEAVRMWSGERNGAGFVLRHDDRDDAGWPAVRGLSLAILAR
jgi:hypothetical protein